MAYPARSLAPIVSALTLRPFTNQGPPPQLTSTAQASKLKSLKSGPLSHNAARRPLGPCLRGSTDVRNLHDASFPGEARELIPHATLVWQSKLPRKSENFPVCLIPILKELPARASRCARGV